MEEMLLLCAAGVWYMTFEYAVQSPAVPDGGGNMPQTKYETLGLCHYTEFYFKEMPQQQTYLDSNR